MIWSIETDDFNGLSGTKYQILNAINSALKSDGEDLPNPPQTPKPSQPTQTSEAPQPGSTQTSEVPQPGSTPVSEDTPTSEKPTTSDGSSICKEEGTVRDPTDCTIYYHCVSNGNEISAIQRNCNHGLVYDPELHICNYPEVVQC